MKKIEKKKNNITVQDIAEHINISASTVSRALNNHPKISQATKEKVWNAAKKLGYQPNIPAYMSTEKTKIICFIVPELNTPFYLDLINSIQEYTSQKGYNLYIAYSNNSIDLEKSLANSIFNFNIEGVIVALFDKNSEISHLKNFLSNNIPTVFINKTDHDIDACKIIPDISHGTYKAVNHLLSMGSKSIYMFTGNLKKPIFADMVDGYNLAMSVAGIEYPKEQIISGSLLQKDFTHTIENLLKRKELPDAIIAPGIEYSSQIISILNNMGYKIPRDIRLVSFGVDNNNICGATAISTIQISGSKTGEIAAKKLISQIKKGKIKNETVIIPTKFIIKGSSMRF